jgi:hypothetical protein
MSEIIFPNTLVSSTAMDGPAGSMLLPHKKYLLSICGSQFQFVKPLR